MVMVPPGVTYSVRCPSERAVLMADAATWSRDNPAKAGVFSMDRALELSLSVEWPHGRRHILIASEPACACCGKTSAAGTLWRVSEAGVTPAHFRCEEHRGRNPCAIPGCGRTRSSDRASNDSFLCNRHWKLVPMAMKLVHRRISRLARKSGCWTNLLAEREMRIWSRIVKTAKIRVLGGEFINLADIEREFGL